MRCETIKKRFLAAALPSARMRRLVIITGARQTGKTTLARSTYPSLAYINLDAPEHRDTARDVSTFSWARDIGPALLDEAQKAPVVFDKVKHAFDAGELKFTVADWGQV